MEECLAMNFRAALTRAACLCVFVAHAASAQTWPQRPIKVVVPFPAGGQLDVVVRSVTERLAPVLGQPIVVETRTGADGNIGAEAVARSAPDGYTWLATSVPFATQISLAPKALHYDPIKDFVAVANLGTSSFVLCVPASLPVHSVEEFVAYAKAHPGAISYAGTSRGSVTHLSTEMFKHATGTDMQFIGYAGIPPALTDLLAGRLQFMSVGIIAAMPHIKSGRLTPLAVLDGERHHLLPDVPSIAEAGYPDLAVSTWFGLLMPAGTPPDIVQRVNTEVMKIVQAKDIVDKFVALGVNPVKPNSPAQFAAFLDADVARWAGVIRDAHVVAE
jgi:tripartite-type tricarboxylate transporter receptor subunit TctC